MNDYEIGLEDRKTGKRWAGENYGWQSQKSFEELYVQGKLNPAQQQIDRLISPITKPLVQAATDFYRNDPVVGPTLRRIGGGISLAFQSAPQPVQQKITEVVQLPQTAAENIAAATGLPVSLTDPFTIADVATAGSTALASRGLRQTVKTAVKSLADDVMTPPTGMVPAMAGVSPSITPRFSGGKVNLSPQVMELTVTKPERIAKGVVEGVAESPQFAKQVSRWEERWKTAHDRLDKWLAETEAPPKVIARNIKKSTAEAYGSVSTGMARLEDMFDEYFYKRMASEGKERHHLFPKAESYQFVKRLKQMIDDGVADMDDMVNLFLYAEDAGTVMGNRKANMLLMEKIKEHGPLHRMRETTEGALGLKMEPKTEDLFARLSEATNADELMDMFDEYLQLNIKPSRRAAFEQTMKKEREFLNVMKPTLSESQRRRL